MPIPWQMRSTSRTVRAPRRAPIRSPVEAAPHVSYAKVASLLARNGSKVRPTTVMKRMRQAGKLCAEEDGRAALSLYRDGVAPEAEAETEELCLEADGTCFRARKQPEGAPRRMEVKALVAYGGKELRLGKVRRRGCVHHALVGRPEGIWAEGGAEIAEKYHLSKVEKVHLGADGEHWCRDAERCFPLSQTVFHLDPFHADRAVMACFADAKMAWCAIDALDDGDKTEAIALLRACLDLGIAHPSRTEQAIRYLEGNIYSIAVEGPSLGTMESENQRLYGARMDCQPCAWSLTGASDMARLISRRESGRAIPRMTRTCSEGDRRRGRRERKEPAFYGRQGMPAASVAQSAGKGYLPPHQVDAQRMDRGKAYALHNKGMADMDRGI